MEEEKYTNDQLYEIIEDPEKLKCYKKMNKMVGLMGADMQFIHDMPYDEIKQFIGEEKEAIFSNIPAEIVADNEVTWEHVGSTSIKGLFDYMQPGINCFRLAHLLDQLRPEYGQDTTCIISLYGHYTAVYGPGHV